MDNENSAGSARASSGIYEAGVPPSVFFRAKATVLSSTSCIFSISIPQVCSGRGRRRENTARAIGVFYEIYGNTSFLSCQRKKLFYKKTIPLLLLIHVFFKIAAVLPAGPEKAAEWYEIMYIRKPRDFAQILYKYSEKAGFLPFSIQ
jgi:hypothetical protein